MTLCSTVCVISFYLFLVTIKISKARLNPAPEYRTRWLILYLSYSLQLGSKEQREVVEFAHTFSTRKEYDIYEAGSKDVTLSLEVKDDIAIGDSFDVKIVARNTSNEWRTVTINISAIVSFYTGISAKPLKQKKETLRLQGKSGMRGLTKL